MTTARPRMSAALAVTGACAVVWLVSELTAPAPAPPSAQVPAVRPTTTTPTTAPPPAPAKATVTAVIDARTVLTSAGERIVVAGLAPPGDCWSDAARDYATETLLGTRVDLVDLTPLLASTLSPGAPSPDAGAPTGDSRSHTATVRLPDGTDYATAALHQGHAKPTRDAPTPHHAAATASGAASLGLWGQPCLGEDVLPVLVPPPSPDPTPATTPTPAPSTTPKPRDYYRNCTAARADGRGPIRRGTPGYRKGLDRDRNGLACER